MSYGFIRVNTRTEPLGPFGYKEFRTYEVEGGDLLEIDRYAILGYPEEFSRIPTKWGERFLFGNLPLRLIEKCVNGGPGLICAVERNWWKWRYLLASRLLRQFVSLVNLRLLATLAVWGLSDYLAGQWLTWSDVYAVRRVKEWLRRLDT